MICKSLFIQKVFIEFLLSKNKLIFTMNLMTTTNHSENKMKLAVFSSSSGSAFRHTVKFSK